MNMNTLETIVIHLNQHDLAVIGDTYTRIIVLFYTIFTRNDIYYIILHDVYLKWLCNLYNCGS